MTQEQSTQASWQCQRPDCSHNGALLDESHFYRNKRTGTQETICKECRVRLVAQRRAGVVDRNKPAPGWSNAVITGLKKHKVIYDPVITPSLLDNLLSRQNKLCALTDELLYTPSDEQLLEHVSYTKTIAALEPKYSLRLPYVVRFSTSAPFAPGNILIVCKAIKPLLDMLSVTELAVKLHREVKLFQTKELI